jgi:hypothetical protein
VTGASSGIGVAFARELSRRGHHVTLAARRVERLEHLAGELGEALAVQCDLTSPDSRLELLARVEKECLEVDVLINCAGFGARGLTQDSDVDRSVELLRTNVEAVYVLTGELVRGMAARGSGAVVIVSSIAGMLRPPVRFAVYGASKAASLRYAEALHYEMRPAGVAVTALCPGAVETEFAAVSGFERQTATTPRIMKPTAEACVREAFAALDKGRPVVIPNRWVRASMHVLGRLPRSVGARLVPVAFHL